MADTHDRAAADSAPNIHLEREIKLEAPDHFQLPDQLPHGMSYGPPWEEHMRTVYFDTVDLRLLNNDVSLRHREGQGWTLKLPQGVHDQALLREEHIFAGDVHDIPDGALDLTQAFIRSAPLRAIARLETTRRHQSLIDAHGNSLGEVIDDRVAAAREAQPGSQFREIEVELAAGVPDKLLGPLVDVLVSHGAIAARPASKVVRALGEQASQSRRRVDEPEDDPSASGLIRDMLRASVESLVRNDPGMRIGSEPEHVHQARVATRRLRSNLRTFATYLDAEWTQHLREELKWLGGALGAVRDAEILLARLSRRVDRLAEEDRPDARALLTRLSDDHRRQRNELLIVLRSPRYLTLLDELDKAVEQPKLAKDTSAGQRVHWRRGVRGPWRKLRRAALALEQDATATAVHRVRIRAKRCRYAAEAVAHLDGSAAQRFSAACQRLQDVLGEHQDCKIAAAWLRRTAATASSREAFAAGQLAMLERKAMAAARAAQPAAWKALNRKKLRRWFR